MGHLPLLRDPQIELLLLRSCMGVAKLLFGLREAIKNIVVCGGSFFGDLQWRIVTLPMRLGGLGLLSARDVAAYAFDYASALERLHESLPDFDLGGFSKKDTAPKKSQKTLANALCCRIAQSLGEDFYLSPRQKAVIECLQRPHAQDFLTVIPIEGLGQRMSAVEYRSILKYRLMIPMFPNDETCPVCRKACLDKYGEHVLHWISAKKEAPVNFLTDLSEGRSTLRPADVLVFGWASGKHACVDLTESKKVEKHAKACEDNQHVFVDMFGSLAPEAVRFLSRVQRVVHSNFSTPQGRDFVFSRLEFSIQKVMAT
ncbi:hypothetical protein Hanom_Chr02g00124051 [Helianthus anomalus]